MKAVKGNKQYTIEESQKKTYQDAGFDIYDTAGNQIAWGRGRTVSYDDHMKAVREIERLQELAAERYAENESLKKELETMKAENAALKAEETGQQAEEPKPGRKRAEKESGE